MEIPYYDISLLYVEDDELTRENVRNLLKRIVAKLHVASNGEEGLDLFRTYNPEIVVTDIMMPCMNGLDMARAIRQLAPDSQIIVLTAFNDTEYLLDCIAIGISRFIRKPVDFQILIQAIGNCSDLVTLKKNTWRQEHSLYLLSQALEQAPTPVMITDTDGVIEYVNTMFTRMTGYGPHEVIGKTPGILKSGATPPELYEDLWQTVRAGKEWEGELANRRKDGLVYWEWMRICPLRNGDGIIIRFLKVCQDITERKNYEARLRYISMHDPLTGLYNRAYFDAEMQRIAGSRDFPVSIVIADINGLKQINDSCGHEEGDQAIRRAAELIMTAFRAGDVIARIGGDEFAVLLPKTDEETAHAVMQRIRSSCINENGNRVCAYSHWLSLGVATAHATNELEATLKEADARMYLDKKAIKRQLSPLPPFESNEFTEM